MTVSPSAGEVMLTRLRVRSALAASNAVSVDDAEERGSVPLALDLHGHALLLDALQRVDQLLEREPRRRAAHAVGALGEPVGRDLDQQDPVGRLDRPISTCGQSVR